MERTVKDFPVKLHKKLSLNRQVHIVHYMNGAFTVDRVMKQSEAGSGVLLQGRYLLSAFHILSLCSLLSCKPVCQVGFERYSSSPLPPPSNFIWIPSGPMTHASSLCK